MITEQRTNLKIPVRIRKPPTEALILLQNVHGDDTISRARAFEWYRSFEDGREDVEDDPRSGRPATTGPRKMSSLSTRKGMQITASLLK